MTKTEGFPPTQIKRIASIDQLRGYAIWGMILVNYLGQFDQMPHGVKHHRSLADWPLWGFGYEPGGENGFTFGFTFADTIAPLFMFVVGMGFRLSAQKHTDKTGVKGMRIAAVRRFSLLVLIGYVIYGFEFQWIWDALVDIGFAGLLAIPFILLGTRARIGIAVGYLVLYQVLYFSPQFWAGFTAFLKILPTSEAYPLLGEWTRWPGMTDFKTYGEWTMKKSIDGGPLGPLSWVFCLLMGTVAYDVMEKNDQKKILLTCMAWGGGLFALGWILRMPWGDIKTSWYFTQYGMTAPYTVASTGTSFLMLGVFYVLADRKGIELPGLSVLGMNALTIYCVQQLLLKGVEWWMPENTRLSIIWIGLVVLMAICYGIARKLYNENIIIKL